MSLRSTSEQRADFRRHAQPSTEGTRGREDRPCAGLAASAEQMCSQESRPTTPTDVKDVAPLEGWSLTRSRRAVDASRRTDELHSAATLLAVEDESVASRSAARLLITASTQGAVEALARRIHGAGGRAELPFVHVWACDLPATTEALREYCAGILDAAAGGSLLIGDVEEMPPIVQDVWLELLDGLEDARHRSAAVRLMSGTTVSLLHRVTDGTFSDRLFYRLNIIHLMTGDHPDGTAPPISPR